jgi:CubicO group peptidase (beta-lactamase class C family)
MSLNFGTPEEAGMSSTRLRHVAQLAQGWVEHGPLHALVTLVARHGIVVMHEAYGTLGPEPDASPVVPDSIFQLASVTKPIVATAIMILVENGLLGLYRPVVDYLPEFAGEGKSAVTVFHLLTHTSGLREEEMETYVTAQFAAKGVPAPDLQRGEVSHNEYLSWRYGAPLWKGPGVEMAYLDYGYELLADIVQRVSGELLTDFLRERIFRPLSMSDTSLIVTDAIRPRIVRASADDQPPDGIGYPALVETPWGSASAVGTALDLARFGQMFLDRGGSGDARVLSPASVAQMTRNQIPGISSQFFTEFFSEASWGLGWSVEDNKRYLGSLYSAETFSHLGSGGICLWIDPVYDLIGVYLSSEHQRAHSLSGWPLDLFMNATMAAVLDV